MKLAIELVPNLSIPFSPHHRYELALTKGDTVFEAARGQDAFSFNGVLLFNEAICGTGRTAVHDFAPDLSESRGTPAQAVEISPEDFCGLVLWLDTNAILAQEVLQTYYSLRLCANGAETLIPLTLLRVHWEGQGLFKIYLDGVEGALAKTGK